MSDASGGTDQLSSKPSLSFVDGLIRLFSLTFFILFFYQMRQHSNNKNTPNCRKERGFPAQTVDL